MKTKSKKKEKDSNTASKMSEGHSIVKEEADENISINKIHIYNNNRHLQKSNSAGEILPFFEPYYSELRNSTNNNLFNKNPVKKSILQIEYVNLPKIDRNIIEKQLPEPKAKQKYAFPDGDLRRYNNYNLNYYNHSYGKNNNNNNDYYYDHNFRNNNYYNYNNFGYNNRLNHGYDKNDFFNNYGNKNKELGELYSQVFLSRDNINDMNSKIRNYYIKSLDQSRNNNRLFNYNQMRNNPRKYTFRNIKKDDIIINDIKASRKFREFVFFQNLKKYIEPKQSIIDEDKSQERISQINKKSQKSKKSSLHSIKEINKEKKEKKVKEKNEEETDEDEEEEEESDEEDKEKNNKIVNKEKEKEEVKKEENEEKKEEPRKNEKMDGNKEKDGKKSEEESSDEEEEESDEEDKEEKVNKNQDKEEKKVNVDKKDDKEDKGKEEKKYKEESGEDEG